LGGEISFEITEGGRLLHFLFLARHSCHNENSYCKRRGKKTKGGGVSFNLEKSRDAHRRKPRGPAARANREGALKVVHRIPGGEERSEPEYGRKCVSWEEGNLRETTKKIAKSIREQKGGGKGCP